MRIKVAWRAMVLAAGAYAGRSAVRAVYRESAAVAALPMPASMAARMGQRPDQRAPAARTSAEMPHSPALNWKQVAKRVFGRISEDRVMAEAASVTYYTLLAIFPAIAALISLYGLIADPSSIGKDLDAISGVVPGGGMQIISDQVHSLTSAPQKALGVGAIIGLLTSLWSANAGIKSLFDAMNAVNGVRETRSFVHLTWLSLAFTAGTLTFLIFAMIAVVVVPAVLNYIGFVSAGSLLLTAARWPALLAVFVLFLSLIYRYGPCRPSARWHWLSLGSGAAAVTWIIASVGFSWYVSNFGSYNKTYGSLGAAVGFMTWIWISTIIILIGAELNAETARQASEGK